MSPDVLLTVIVGFIGTLLTAVFVPLYLNHRKELRDRARDKAKDEAAARKEAERLDRERAEGSEVTWEAINGAIVRERDTLKKDFRNLQASHRVEVQRLKERHERELATQRQQYVNEIDRIRENLDREAQEMKQRYDQQLADLATHLEATQQQLGACQQQMQELYGELWVMQHPVQPPRG